MKGIGNISVIGLGKLGLCIAACLVDKGIIRTNLPSLKRLFKSAGLANIQFRRYALLLSRFAVRFRFVLGLNEFLLKLPLIRSMSLFTWIKGEKA